MPRQFDRLLIEAVTQCRPPLRQQRVKYLRLRNVGVSLHRPRDGTPPVTHAPRYSRRHGNPRLNRPRRESGNRNRTGLSAGCGVEADVLPRAFTGY